MDHDRKTDRLLSKEMMMKNIAYILFAIVLTASFTVAEEKFTVSGELNYLTDADIYVCLHTNQTFPDWKKTLPPGSFTKKVKANPSGKVEFTFTHVPKGEYLIMAFEDQNGNGTLDCTTWGFPQETFWTYKKNAMPGFGTNWHDQKFDVNANVSGIVIE
jgi:uncharacterized protein (DUF2141 family)